eukprot:75419-Rhodomonas_salina.1
MAWSSPVGLSGFTPEARSGHAMASVGGQVFVFGGRAAGRFSPQLGCFWTVGRYENRHHLIGITDEGMELSDGELLGDLSVYDPVRRVWELVGDTAGDDKPSPRQHAQLAAAGDDLLLFGECMCSSSAPQDTQADLRGLGQQQNNNGFTNSDQTHNV